MLADEGFSVVETQRAVGMYGSLYEVDSTHNATSEENVTDFNNFTVENFVFLLDYFSSALMQAGAVEGKKGIKVTDEAERKLMLQEIRDGFNTDGAMSVGRFFLVMKPMEE